MTQTPSPKQFEEERAYLLEMIRHLVRLARTAGEIEVEILLRAILEITQANARRRAS